METVEDRPPPPQDAPPRLTRATHDKVLSGLCGGLGRYFGVDPVVFRIAFVVLALAGGSGVLLYLVGWVLVPDDAGRTAGGSYVGTERNQKLLAAVLAGVGLLLIVDQLTDDDGADVPVGLALIGVGALVLWSRRDGGTGPGQPLPSPPPAPGEPLVAAAGPAVPTEPPSAPAVPAEPPVEPPGPRSVLVPVTLSLLLVVAGGLALAGVSLQAALAVLLLVTGGALVVGTSRGRARWLIPVGLVLAVALAGAAAADRLPLRGGAGERLYQPAALGDVLSPYRLAAGELTVDLRRVDLAGGSTRIVASVGVGKLIVVVPDDVAVDVDGHVGLGELRLLGRTWGGTGLDERLADGGGEGTGRLEVDVRAGVGSVEVRRAPA